MATVELRDVTKTFSDGNVAVDGLNLDIHDGEFMVLLGPSGCGKSTVLRMVAGLEDPTGGDVYIDGELSTDLLPREREVAMVFQDFALYPHMTVGENMGFSLKLRNDRKDVIDARVKVAAKILNLEPYLQRYPRELSGGQRQRVAIARALVNNPSIILADEPTGNLDSQTGNEIMKLMEELHKKGNTIVLVTHEADIAEHAYRVVHIKDGVVASDERKSRIAPPD